MVSPAWSSRALRRGGLGEGFGGDGVDLGFAVLVDGEMEGAGVEGFERDRDVDHVRLVSELPLGGDFVLPAAVSSVMDAMQAVPVELSER